MYKFKIKVGQAYNFYEIIGTEDKNSIVIDDGDGDEEESEENYGLLD